LNSRELAQNVKWRNAAAFSAHRMWAERPPGVGAYVTNGGANDDAANGGAIVHQRGWRS
jgi:hypothetical protein